VATAQVHWGKEMSYNNYLVGAQLRQAMHYLQHWGRDGQHRSGRTSCSTQACAVAGSQDTHSNTSSLVLPAQDADAAYQCCCDYSEPTCVIVKHTNPCGIATRNDLLEAYRLAVSDHTHACT
jgi:AICAR transformylase/IMP cyclohydrolase PurH